MGMVAMASMLSARGRRGLFVATMVLPSLVGCGAILLGSDDDDGTPNPSSEAGDDRSINATDGSVGRDGGGGDDGASKVGFCATQPSHTFCADFDLSADITQGFTSSDLPDGSIGIGLTANATSFQSAPRALQLTVGSAPLGSKAWLFATLKPLRKVSVEWEAQSTMAKGDVHLLSIRLRNGPVEIGVVAIEQRSDESWMLISQTTNANSRTEYTLKPLANVWYHYKLEITFGTPGKLAFTGTPLTDASAVLTIDASSNAATADNGDASDLVLVVGGEVYVPLQGKTLETTYDNITVDTTTP